MSIDPREALNRLIAALEQHYDVAQNADVMLEAVLEDAEERLRDAFFTYDDVLFTTFGAEMPFEMLDEDFDDDDDDILFEGEDDVHDIDLLDEDEIDYDGE